MASMKLWYAFCAVLLVTIVVIAADPNPLSEVALAMGAGTSASR